MVQVAIDRLRAAARPAGRHDVVREPGAVFSTLRTRNFM
jgi:hypothetical protein